MRILLFFAATLALHAQVAGQANERYQTKEARQGLLANLSAADRAVRLHGEAIVEALALQPGMTVADLGTGGGAMLPLLSRAVGAAGQVYAEDVFEDFIDKAKALHKDLSNVTFILGSGQDPALPPATVDVALAVDSYHHWDSPAAMLAGVRKGLKSGGRFVIVDYYRRPGAMPGGDALHHIRLDQDDVVKEVCASGFRLVQAREHVPGQQYIAIFAR